MNWLLFFLKDLKMNLPQVLSVVLILVVVTVVGMIFFRFLVDCKKLTIIIPGGMVLGSSLLILYLGILSYFFKGQLGIWIIFLIFLTSAIFIYRKHKSELVVERLKINTKNIVIGLLVFVVSSIFFIRSGNAIWGGDAITYWGFATSFARGNYPMILPWQPQFLTVHHQGAFLFEGAVHALSGVDIRVVHFIFAAFIILGGFLLLWGYVSDKTKKPILSIIPSLLGYVAFGGIFIILAKNMVSSVPQLTIPDLPVISNFKDALGALTSVSGLYYLIPRTVNLAIIILIFILIAEKIKRGIVLKLLAVSTLSVVTLSVDESMFAAIILPIIAWIAFDFVKSKEKILYMKGLVISGIVFICLFWIVGNPIRDSILTPSLEAPRFKIVDIQTAKDQGRAGFLQSIFVTSQNYPNIVWYLPDFRLLLGTSLLLVIISGNIFLTLFLLAAIGSTTLYFFVDHTFWPGNYARFLLMGYQFIGFLVGGSIIFLLGSKSKIRRILSIALLIIIIPTCVSSVRSVTRSIISSDNHYPNFSPLTTRHKVLDWISNNLPYNSKIFFIDGFLRDANYSDLTLQGIQGYGLYIPISSVNYKMHTAEYGVEAIDLITTLDPQSLRSLKIDYLYIKSNVLSNFSLQRQKDISNVSFFKPVYTDEAGTLYEVLQSYNATGNENTIKSLSQLILPSSSIFIDSVPSINFYVRAAMILGLEDSGDLYSIWGSGHYNYVEKFLTINDISKAGKYDYLVLGPKTNPLSVCKCSSVKKIWQNETAQAYKVLK